MVRSFGCSVEGLGVRWVWGLGFSQGATAGKPGLVQVILISVPAMQGLHRAVGKLKDREPQNHDP